MIKRRRRVATLAEPVTQVAQILDVREQQPWTKAFMFAYERAGFPHSAPHRCSSVLIGMDGYDSRCGIPSPQPLFCRVVHVYIRDVAAFRLHNGCAGYVEARALRNLRGVEYCRRSVDVRLYIAVHFALQKFAAFLDRHVARDPAAGERCIVTERYRGGFRRVTDAAHDGMNVDEALLVDPELRGRAVATPCADHPHGPSIPRSFGHDVEVLSLLSQHECGRIHRLAIETAAKYEQVVAQLASLPRSAVSQRVEGILPVDADVPVVVRETADAQVAGNRRRLPPRLAHD